MGFFKRLFKIGQSEAHSLIDKLEDPIKLTEQGIRDMKQDLDKALHALAQVKALAIRSKNEAESAREKSKDYEQKAVLLLQKAQKGQMDPAEADRLAQTALQKKEENQATAKRASDDQKRNETQVANLESKIRKLKTEISKWENELRTLKARSKVSQATKNVNKQLAQIDSSSTVSMLERMKEKVEQDEALSEAYGDIANESRSVDEELDQALENTDQSDELAALKSKLGMNKTDQGPTDDV
jgi:phage shock protein A